MPLEQANLQDNEQLSQPEERPPASIRQTKGRGAASKKQQRAEAGEEVDPANLTEEQEAKTTPSMQTKADKKASGSKKVEDKTKMEESKQSEGGQTKQSTREGAQGMGQSALAGSADR